MHVGVDFQGIESGRNRLGMVILVFQFWWASVGFCSWSMQLTKICITHIKTLNKYLYGRLVKNRMKGKHELLRTSNSEKVKFWGEKKGNELWKGKCLQFLFPINRSLCPTLLECEYRLSCKYTPYEQLFSSGTFKLLLSVPNFPVFLGFHAPQPLF